jgi:hypothetical protein
MVDTAAQRSELLAEARAFFGVPAATAISGVVDLLEGYGAEPFDYVRHERNLVDEFVDPSLIVGAWTITDAQLLMTRATDVEREHLTEDPDDDFDPLEYGPENEEWTTWVYEIGTLRRLIVLIEHHAGNRDEPGNFRVHGAGQWLRETLWAATGVVPRDPGPTTVDSVLFLRAFVLDGRKAGSALPIEQ